ncbi:MAG: competence protein CoiA family protein [Pusillimonas sp.]
MFSALDSENSLIDIDTAIQNPSNKYFCPSCRGELVIKTGPVRTNHFSHKRKCDCDDYDNDMSEWHRNWQKKFPLKNREVVLKLDKENPLAMNCEKLIRRTDILCYGYAIEFQNSPISSLEFFERNYFYKLLGKKVVWIFNMIDAYESNTIECYGEWDDSKDNGGKFSWKYASKTFINYNHNDKDVILFFQLSEINENEDDINQCYLERVIWAINSNSDDEDTNFKKFYTSYYPGNFTELMERLKRKDL